MGAVVLAIFTASLLVSCTNLALAVNEPKVIHVGGKVLCQDCTQGWNEWVHGCKPIKGNLLNLVETKQVFPPPNNVSISWVHCRW